MSNRPGEEVWANPWSLFHNRKVPGMASDITSEADFLEKNPSPWTLESESGKWMSNTPIGTPGKGELYYSATDDGALTKHMECGNQKKMQVYCIVFLGLHRQARGEVGGE